MIICRVCLDSNDKLIPLISDDEDDACPLVYMLNEFTIINAEKQLPKYICETCAAHLDVAYAFKRKYEDSVVRFIRQTSCYEETDATMTGGGSELYSQNEDQAYYSKQHDVKVFPKSISLDNIPSDGVEQLNDNSNDTQHDRAGYSNTWKENDVDLTRNVCDNESVGAVSEEYETIQGPSQDIINEHQESNVPPDEFNDQEGYGGSSYSEGNNDDENQESSFRPFANSNQERDGDLWLSDQSGTNNENRESNLPLDVYNNQEQDHDLCNSNINQQDINNEVQEPSVLPGEFNNQEIGDGTLLLVNANQPNEIDRENAQPEELMQYLNLKRSQTKPTTVLSEIYHYGYGIEPFKCDICSRWFKTKGHIKAHLFRHYVGEKRINCKKCPLTFLTKPHFRNHRCFENLK